MIRLDRSTGSGELLDLFTPYGVKVMKTKLQFGDMDWTGKGPKGSCAVVVERKRIDDLIQSMNSKRLSGHQLPGMAENYDYGYLVVEGLWKPGDGGEVQVLVGAGRWVSRGMHYRAVTNYLMGLSLRAGMNVWRTATKEETVRFVVDQYRMWTEKAWGEHTAHEAVYAPAEAMDKSGRVMSLRMREVSVCEKMLMQLPGLDAKARWAAEHFEGNVYKAAAAGVGEWMEVKWMDKKGVRKKLGRETAQKIVEALRGEGVRRGDSA